MCAETQSPLMSSLPVDQLCRCDGPPLAHLCCTVFSLKLDPRFSNQVLAWMERTYGKSGRSLGTSNNFARMEPPEHVIIRPDAVDGEERRFPCICGCSDHVTHAVSGQCKLKWAHAASIWRRNSLASVFAANLLHFVPVAMPLTPQSLSWRSVRLPNMKH